MINLTYSRTQILWSQIWGLAALLVAIKFSWMAYSFYQPKILQQMEFVYLASWLGIFQGFLAAIVEPFIGRLSDLYKSKIGSRLPMITVGVTLAGLIFVIFAFLVEQNIQGELRWAVPVLMTFWVIAMIIFRGPAVALLRQFAPETELPLANSVLLFVLSLLGAVNPILNLLLEKIGASITFLCGAIVLVLGTYLLRSRVPQHSVITKSVIPCEENNLPEKIQLKKLCLIFLTSFVAGLQANILLSIFPKILQTQLPIIPAPVISSGILLVSASLSIYLGNLSAKIGSTKSLLLGLILMTCLMGISLINQISFLVFVLIFAFGISFGLIFNSVIPLALKMLPDSQSGLATGMSIGGGGFATAIVSTLVNIGIQPISGFYLAVASLLIVIFVLKK